MDFDFEISSVDYRYTYGQQFMKGTQGKPIVMRVLTLRSAPLHQRGAA